ncbi:phospholipase A and acyltransferase 3-like [Heptranchias perlo]|uniref:phospholipase A and acyltransferase 3-like n=1 Tax=Heptranchias perlo TaxID=212740 RepID=UPI00355AC7BA
MGNLNESASPKEGDLIEISRPLYKHWAIYVGNGEVIHLTGDGGSMDFIIGSSSSAITAVIKRERLTEVAGNYPYRINNSSDRIWTPFPVDQIIKRAEAKLGNKEKYKITAANCEHFVNEVRYNMAVSNQVMEAVAAGVGLGVGVGAAGVGVGVGAAGVGVGVGAAFWGGVGAGVDAVDAAFHGGGDGDAAFWGGVGAVGAVVGTVVGTAVSGFVRVVRVVGATGASVHGFVTGTSRPSADERVHSVAV